MAVSTDRRYLFQISNRLERFTRKGDDLYVFRCPYCGDSKKNKLKARGYIYRKKNDYFFKCHNCKEGHNFDNFLKFVDPTIHNRYIMERFSQGENKKSNYEKPDIKEAFKTDTYKKLNSVVNLPRITDLPVDHPAAVYLRGRKIPENRLFDLYWAEDFFEFIKSLEVDKTEEQVGRKGRIVIPFVDRNGTLVYVQGRALEGIDRYATIRLDETAHKIYNLDKINLNEKVFVFEGPFDSMFVPNSVATADSNLESAVKVLRELGVVNIVIVYDNEPRNKQIVKSIEQALEHGEQVVIWDDKIEQKDINDMVLAGLEVNNIPTLLNEHTQTKLLGKLALSSWKRS